MRVVTPTASGASCVLGLQRAWAQPRRTDSSTCSATSSHTPSVGISQLECTCGKKKWIWGRRKKKSGCRRGQKTQRSERAKDPAPCFQPFFRRGLHPLVHSRNHHWFVYVVQARENNPASSAVSHSFVGVCTPLFIAVTIIGSYCTLCRRGKTTQRALRSAILSSGSAPVEWLY